MKYVTLTLLISSLLLLSGCGKKQPGLGRIAGFTQGTTYSIIYADTDKVKTGIVYENITDLFQRIDHSMSLYIDSSIISRINRNEDVAPDKYFIDVFNKSKEISQISQGAFDVTVGPLVKAWGFGPDAHKNFDASKLDSLLNLVGYAKIDIRNGKLLKQNPGITIDFNAIAQGYTVDVVCDYFNSLGLKDYLVEIGGEVRVKGTKGGKSWRIGIDRPIDNNMIPGADLQVIVSLKDKSLATSGNYRKFYVENGVKYSHTIDPRTGYPSKNQLLSATLIADDCATADGLATACMVMGLEKAKDFVQRQPGIDAFFIFSGLDGEYNTWTTEGMKDLLQEP